MSDIEQNVSGVSDLIAEWSEKKTEILRSTDTYTQEYINNKNADIDAEYSSKIVERTQRFREAYQSDAHSVTSKVSEEARIYKPEDLNGYKLSQILFQNELASQSNEEIISGWEEAVEKNNKERAQLYEDLGIIELKKRRTPLSERLKQKIAKAQQSRYSDSTRRSIEKLEKHKSLYLASEGIIKDLTTRTPESWAKAFHVWLGLSNSSHREKLTGFHLSGLVRPRNTR